MRDPEVLSKVDNEIWLEKIHFDFSPEGHFLKGRVVPENEFFVSDG